jgi:gluconokinase
MQAAFEGVAFRVRSIYDMLCEIMGRPERVILSGGFAQTEKGKRVICDVLGREVEVSNLPSASARGAFLVSLKALGEVKGLAELPDAFFPRNPVLEPIAEHALFYDQLYKLYWEIYRRNVDLFERFVALKLA